MIMASSFVPPTMILDLALMAMLVVVAFAIVRLRSLFAIVMLQGVYSLVCAAWFVSLDAVDVAFTEAAVGAGVSTVLMLSAMLLADRKSEAVPISKQIAPLIVVIVAGLAMFYAIGDMPAYGDANSPANSGPGMDFIERTTDEIHIPNVVTAVLASYRGYDTFGEAVVIFAAGLGVLLLLGLNGNAGRWSASPNGQRISAPSAPSAATPEPEPQPTQRPQVATARKRPVRELDIPATPKEDAAPKRRGRPKGSKNKAKSAVAKTADTPKKSSVKPSATSAPKKRGRPAGSKNKPKTVAAKTAAKAAPKRGRGRPKGSKNKPKTGGTS
jgi:multicomponent Na+:H+ antiporter subunit B